MVVVYPTTLSYDLWPVAVAHIRTMRVSSQKKKLPSDRIFMWFYFDCTL